MKKVVEKPSTKIAAETRQKQGGSAQRGWEKAKKVEK